MLGLIKARRADATGAEWTLETFKDEAGNVEAVRLYDPDGWFVAEFYDQAEAERFVDRVNAGE